ncbi:hypothetical protein HBI75_206860 [Parastagonospora nodorum]|nr:hypothetical protein HBH51_171060 [Parastagonospora nodorum]KAH4181883.1 hypothetical protein HBH42_228940 [Parastagonospora nodorum]KAH4918631.1 hypothetical protein HBI79_208710 [Parastagonospora nodorum]KAH4989290.1 hypothetical protein HBI76_071530 [Parastagonospora nodorum]KAH5010077.1 hypothetical protein HBI75_206860 [Parastagonospora nodorum]
MRRLKSMLCSQVITVSHVLSKTNAKCKMQNIQMPFKMHVNLLYTTPGPVQLRSMQKLMINTQTPSDNGIKPGIVFCSREAILTCPPLSYISIRKQSVVVSGSRVAH